ncbi:MAG: AAA family ATPase, partial [Deltaproteobacteria bacterium]|nr:AAA family ATPase [Deltaproteobacteria bacterium]
MRLILYTGKGGVGKTTTAAATAACAAARGRRTLVASADAAHSLGDVLEQRLEPTPTRVAPNLDAIEIDARVEML